MTGHNKAPLLIAHRGMSRQYPENTMPAFEAAIAAGADMIELDISLTSDGAFVVIHDDTLVRTTDSAGFVCHFPSEELQSMDAGHWFGAAPETIFVPSLDQVLDQIAGRITLNIEVKPFFPLTEAGRMQAALARMMTLINERGLADQVILSSVNFYLLEYIRELDESIRLGLIYRRPLTDFDPVAVCEHLQAYSLHPYYRQTTAELVQALHHIDVKVFPYTVNKPKRFKRMLEIGVDGVFTDVADELRTVLESS